MGLRWALPLVIAVVIMPLRPAEAQFGDMPGMPGSRPQGFGAPQPQQQGPPPACQELLTYRDETQKHGLALQAGGKKKAPPEQICKLFKAYLAAESKMIKGIARLGSQCGVPAEVSKQLKTQHAKAEQTAKQVCEAAAQGPRPAGPTLSDALGTTPTVPDTGSRRGMGTFDTLSGSPLTR
jgi:hypothetical protein